jgi:hypothetical protein
MRQWIVPFSRIVEDRIREAMAEGKFDNLAKTGQPIDLEEYFKTPDDLRMAYSILKSAGCAPVEVELMKEASQLKQAIIAATEAGGRVRLERTLTERQTQLAVMLERRARGER